MNDWTNKKVRAEHLVNRNHVLNYELEGVGPSDIWFMKEMYNGQTVATWEQTAKGKIVQVCLKAGCTTYSIIKEFSKINPKLALKDWQCPRCTVKQNATAVRIKSKNRYEVELPKRVMEFSRALRKRHPEFNSRKSRISNEIIINGRKWSIEDGGARKKINLLGYEFNLHVKNFYGADPNGDEDRIKFDLHDISPMFDEHFRDHGHRGGIRKENR